MRTIVVSTLIMAVSIGCSTEEKTTKAVLPPAKSKAEQPVTAGPDPGWQVDELKSPTGYSSVSPQLTAQSGRVILSWLTLNQTYASLRFAERTATGWTAARTVIEGEDLMVNTADVPSVIALANGTLAAHWLQADGSDGESYKLPLSWSKDSGATWSPPQYPHHDGKQVQHGFASLFQAPGAGLGLVWLDGRATAASDGNAGSMNLWMATYGLDGRQVTETVLDSRVCDCCPLSAAATSDGIVVAYRDRTGDEIRDTSVARFEGGRWSAPVTVHDDGWKINGCPVNGPAISARGQEVVVAWFTAANDQGRAFVAFSHDGGRSFDAPIRVDDKSSLGEVDVELLSDGSSAVTWIEFGKPSQSRLRRIESSGARSPAVTLADLSKGRAARLVQAKDELVVAWPEVENGGAVVKTVRVSLQ